ncbi:hypothetical protein BAU18_000859 [Enterococcus diestrammenae]|uniref:Uncharacterized protein n=1 Tax=Enterococcus diestrammenae TaxID=1155073 RepID=A0ABV0EZN5_9ENTE
MTDCLNTQKRHQFHTAKAHYGIGVSLISSPRDSPK